MIKIVCNGCRDTQDAVHTIGFIPKPLTPWIHLKQKVPNSRNVGTDTRDINLCEKCANKAGLR